MAELVVAADVNDAARLKALLDALEGRPVWVKLGLEALSAFGYGAIEAAAGRGFKVFADVKYHDIPNTVGAASRVLARTGASMFNVHCAGGAAMCAAARKESDEEATRLGRPRPLVLGVTVLTSLSEGDLAAVGYAAGPLETAEKMAAAGKAGGLDGVVCSVHEAAAIKSRLGREFLTLTPGIRPAGGEVQDQKRVATPAGAVGAGADFLVVGRPITGAPDPAKACDAILAEMREAQG